jgi:hypothetical protein
MKLQRKSGRVAFRSSGGESLRTFALAFCRNSTCLNAAVRMRDNETSCSSKNGRTRSFSTSAATKAFLRSYSLAKGTFSEAQSKDRKQKPLLDMFAIQAHNPDGPSFELTEDTVVLEEEEPPFPDDFREEESEEGLAS